MCFMFWNACRMRASSPDTRLSVLGSMPRMPAMNRKSPARVARPHVAVGLMAPCGATCLTPFCWAVSVPLPRLRAAIRAIVFLSMKDSESWNGCR